MKEKNRLFKNKQNEIDSAKLRHELFKAGARYCQEHQLQVFNKVKKTDIEETIEELGKLGQFYETQLTPWSGNDAQLILLSKEVLLTAVALGDVVPWLLLYLQLSLSLFIIFTSPLLNFHCPPV